MSLSPSWIAPALLLATSSAAQQQHAADPPLDVPVPVDLQLGPQLRVDAGRGTSACNETTIAISRADPLHVVAAWNDYREGGPRIGVGVSVDGGGTWADGLLRPPLPYQSSTEADPMTAADARTGTLWVGGISFGANGGVFVARKDPGSSAFEPVVMAYSGGGSDKGMMAAGPRPGGTRAARRGSTSPSTSA